MRRVIQAQSRNVGLVFLELQIAAYSSTPSVSMKWTRRTVAILLIIRISAASSFSPIAAAFVRLIPGAFGRFLSPSSPYAKDWPMWA